MAARTPRFTGFVPTPRLVLLAFLGVPPLLLGFVVPELRPLVAAYDLVLLLAALFDRHYARRVRVEASRHPKGRLNVGVENHVVVQLRNTGDEPAKLLVRDDAPFGFRPRGNTFEKQVKPHSRESHTYAVTPPRRGKFTFGALNVRAEGPLGLCRVELTVPAELAARVYPDMRGAARLLLATASRDLASLGLRRFRKDGSGSEFARLREYVQGDQLRDVDWKATARRRRPVTRVHETERSQTLMICVDAGRTMAARVDVLTKLDYAVNAALFLAFVAIRNGDRVGVVVFADGVKSFLSPKAGRTQYRRIVDALYDAEASLTFVDYQALFRELYTRLGKRALVAIFTDLLDEEQGRSLVAPLHRLAKRHVPLCITLRDQALEELLRETPREPDDAFRQAVAVELLEERENLKQLVAREGVQLLDAPPKELTIAAVNRYLEVKRRGLL